MTIESTKVAPKSKKPENVESTTDTIEDAIKSQVLERLGKPSVKHLITARNVFDNNWRVNVWIDKDEHAFLPQFVIKHSFFVTVSPEGGIIRSNKEIVKQYG